MITTIIIILIILGIIWWALSIWAASSSTQAPTKVKNKRQLRIEKHSWDKDEYWVGGALLLLLVIRLFWR